MELRAASLRAIVQSKKPKELRPAVEVEGADRWPEIQSESSRREFCETVTVGSGGRFKFKHARFGKGEVSVVSLSLSLSLSLPFPLSLCR